MLSPVAVTTMRWTAVFVPSLTATLWLTTREGSSNLLMFLLLFSKIFAVLSGAFLWFVAVAAVLAHIGKFSYVEAVGRGPSFVISLLVSTFVIGFAQNLIRAHQRRPKKPIFWLTRSGITR